MKVYIDTDLEGISGVTIWDQTRNPQSALYQEARRLLMGDVNAAVAGCFDGGATSVVVLDGHGGGFNFLPELMDPRAEWVTGVARAAPCLGLDDSFDCAVLVGFHAMRGTPDGVLCHTQSSRADCRYWYNDRETGEIGQSALLMGHWGVPLVMVTGDVAACREARAFLGEEIVTVAVKEGYGRQCCKMIPPQRAQEMIRAGAQEALGRVGRCRPYVIELPIRGRFDALAQLLPDDASDAEIAAAPRHSVEKVFDTALDILKF